MLRSQEQALVRLDVRLTAKRSRELKSSERSNDSMIDGPLYARNHVDTVNQATARDVEVHVEGRAALAVLVSSQNVCAPQPYAPRYMATSFLAVNCLLPYTLYCTSTDSVNITKR